MDDANTSNFVEVAADLVSAYVSNNSVRPSEIPELLVSVHAALTGLASGAAEPVKEELKPPVPIKKSVTPDFIISLEDGRQYKSLKRHLRGRGLTPEEYRQKWGLPIDYPMVAPSYAKQRSELAKALGLGQIRRDRTESEAPLNDTMTEEATVLNTPAKRGRKKTT